jgi:hypothetical protein
MTAPVNFLLGMNAKLYYGATASPIPAITTLVEASNIMDLKIPGDTTVADITTRANGGYAAEVATLINLKLTFKMLWKPGDAFFTALLAAWQAKSTVHIAALDQAQATTGAQGPKGDFSVTNFTIDQPLKEGQTIDVTLSLSVFDTWFTKGA